MVAEANGGRGELHTHNSRNWWIVGDSQVSKDDKGRNSQGSAWPATRWFKRSSNMEQVVVSPAGTVHLIRFPLHQRKIACGLDTVQWGPIRATFGSHEVLCERCRESANRHGFVIPQQK
jgi:hypothetical protein